MNSSRLFEKVFELLLDTAVGPARRLYVSTSVREGGNYTELCIFKPK
jgi:hypothetical protein